jgi:hypothetical protein
MPPALESEPLDELAPPVSVPREVDAGVPIPALGAGAMLVPDSVKGVLPLYGSVWAGVQMLVPDSVKGVLPLYGLWLNMADSLYTLWALCAIVWANIVTEVI